MIAFRYTKEEFNSVNNIYQLSLDNSKDSLLLIIVKEGIDLEIWDVGVDDSVDEFTLINENLRFKNVSCEKYFVLDLWCSLSEGIPGYNLKLIDGDKVFEYYIQAGNYNENFEFPIII